MKNKTLSKPQEQKLDKLLITPEYLHYILDYLNDEDKNTLISVSKGFRANTIFHSPQWIAEREEKMNSNLATEEKKRKQTYGKTRIESGHMIKGSMFMFAASFAFAILTAASHKHEKTALSLLFLCVSTGLTGICMYVFAIAQLLIEKNHVANIEKTAAQINQNNHAVDTSELARKNYIFSAEIVKTPDSPNELTPLARYR